MRHLALVVLVFAFCLGTGVTAGADRVGGVRAEPATHPVVGTWVVRNAVPQNNDPVALAFSADGTVTLLTVDGEAREGSWESTGASAATTRLLIPETYIQILMTVAVSHDDMRGGFDVQLVEPAPAGSRSTTVIELERDQALTAIRIT